MQDTLQLAKFVTEVHYSDLSEDVIRMVKNILVDSIGCALGGYCVDKAKIVNTFVYEMGGSLQATVIGGGLTSASNAAFANGELINALDSDCNGPLVGHVIPYSLPPCLALAEMNHSSGKDLILAAAIAIEIGGRVGASVLQHRIPSEEPPYFKYSPRYSYGTGVFGGIAGACKILKMDIPKICNALGIGGISTPVPGAAKWQHISGPVTMIKYNSWAGWVAQLGIVSALMANKGFTADSTILDGDLGFWQMYGSPFFRREIIFDNLGKVWRLLETEFKPYPSCGCNHGGMDGIIKLMKENRINPDDINEIKVLGDSFLLTPNRSQKKIEGSLDTEFSVTYGFAMAAYYGERPGPHWTMPIVYNDPRVVNMMKKVKVEKHPRADELIQKNMKAGKAPVLWMAQVEITANGKKYSTEILEPWGKGGNMFKEDDIERKFNQNVSFSALPLSQAEKIPEMLRELEKIDDVIVLAEAIRVSK